MQLSLENFYTLPQYKKTALRIKDGTIYKRCRFPEDKDNLRYLKKLSIIEGAIVPQKILRDKNLFYGYTTKEIPNSINIDEYLQKPIEIDIISTMKSIFELLRKINEFIIIGDVRNANILLADDKVYLCDLESGTKDKKPKYLLTYYSIFYSHNDYLERLNNSILSDNIKAFISALCLYYGINFETICLNRKMLSTPNLNMIYELLIEAKSNPLLIEYLYSIFDDIEFEKTTPSIDIIKLLDYVNPPRTKEVESLKRCLKL